MMKVVHKHFHQLASTNTWVLDNSSTLDRNVITAVTAHMQTAGRGRRQRPWFSPPGSNLLLTYALFLPQSFSHIANIGQLMALCCSAVVEKWSASCRLKWPNDLYIQNRKVGGILCETQQCVPHTCIAIGVGLNVNMTQAALDAIDQPATSLMLEGGRPVAIKAVADTLDEQFLNVLPLFQAEGFFPFISAYQQRIGIGKRICFSQGDKIVEGHLVNVTETGAIVLEKSDGHRETFYSGEVIDEGRLYSY